MIWEAPRETLIYFAQCDFGGPIKIGHSYNMPGRIAALSKDIPFNLVEIGSVRGGLFGERFIQCWFRRHQIKGEWFAPVPELWRWALQARTTGRVEAMPCDISSTYVACSEALVRCLKYRDISLEVPAKHAGIEADYLAILLKSPSISSRKIIAAFTVALLKHGDYPDFNFLAFRPPVNSSAPFEVKEVS